VKKIKAAQRTSQASSNLMLKLPPVQGQSMGEEQKLTEASSFKVDH